MKPKSLAWRLFDWNAVSLSVRAASYQRQVDTGADEWSLTATERPQEEIPRGLRDVHFAFLPERYEPLVDNEAEQGSKEARKQKKKEKYKKVKKRVGKAWRGSWKCLMLGLHSLALAYTTPISAAATCFTPDFQPGRG